eukprot:Pompholyxophrys_punicea_v1_NODE_659_length_1505_cov_1.995862.p1 type:complete len:220 gc:universal NODE_659_length_1505_cov_1.995862:1312-653(-)
MKKLTSAQARSLECYLRVLTTGTSKSCTGNVHKHHGSMVGRDFKSFAQLAVFALASIKADDETLNLWCHIAELVKTIYNHNTSTEQPDYVNLLMRKILFYLRETSSPLLKRAKWHLLLHISQNMELYGPATGFQTERQESMNGVIRHHLIYSNHSATSLDTATSFSFIEGFNHLLQGGRWGSELQFQAGTAILEIAKIPEISEHFLGNSRASKLRTPAY